jgi:polysaccharide export outer membrane protein
MKTIMALVAGLLLGLVSAAAPALAQGYHVRPGDILKIEVLEDPSLNRSVLVAPDGRISMPMVGNLKVSGQSVDSVAAGLASKMAGNFAAPPNVSVSLERLAERVGGGAVAAPATIDVYVMGQAAKAGRMQLAPGTTVLQAFAEMGGFSKFAATKRIQLRRGATTYKLNYDMIEAGTSTDGGTTLKDGDVIVVPQRKLFE